MNTLRTLLTFLLVTYIGNTFAIVIRHDTDEEKYRDYAKSFSTTMAYINGCAGTLISDYWIVTAAHCVYHSENSIFSIRYLEKEHRISRILLYPNYDDKSGQEHDLALVHLKDPVLEGTPAKLYIREDEKGKSVVFVGKGMLGNGIDGLIKDDQIERAATNTVANVSNKWLIFDFNEPDNATLLEGISGPGDSGGPALFVEGSELYLAGVSSWQERFGKPEGTYNVREYYTRVSKYTSWIESTLKSISPPLLPKHPAIDAIKKDNLDSLIEITNKDKSWFANETLLREVLSQTLLNNNIQMMEALVDMGAPVSEAKINGLSLYEFSLLNRRNDYFLALVSKTYDEINIHDSDSKILPLLASRFINDKRLFSLLNTVIKQGANINAISPQGDTALLIVGWHTNDLKLVKLLVERGANINAANHNGDTPLMDSAYLGRTNIFKYLLERGANTEQKNKNGMTALDLAKSNKREHIIKILTSM